MRRFIIEPHPADREPLNTDKGITEAEERKQITTVAELVDYYKDIFTLLSSCASRQLEEITFRRSEVPVERLAGLRGSMWKRPYASWPSGVELEAEAEPVSVTGDEILLRFLLEISWMSRSGMLRRESWN